MCFGEIPLRWWENWGIGNIWGNNNWNFYKCGVNYKTLAPRNLTPNIKKMKKITSWYIIKPLKVTDKGKILEAEEKKNHCLQKNKYEIITDSRLFVRNNVRQKKVSNTEMKIANLKFYIQQQYCSKILIHAYKRCIIHL